MLLITKKLTGFVNLFIVLLKLNSKTPIKVAQTKGEAGINQETSNNEGISLLFVVIKRRSFRNSTPVIKYATTKMNPMTMEKNVAKA